MADQLDQSVGNPLVVAIWNVLRDRHETDIRLVFDTLAARPTTPSARQAILDLQRCARETGATHLSRRLYDNWHSRLPEGVTALSSTAIRKAFDGSWLTALDRAGLAPVADVTVRRLTALGSFYTAEEVEAALRRCAREVRKRPLLQTDFITWGQRRKSEMGGRFPTSASTFIRTHGSWRALCEKVGLAPQEGAREKAIRCLRLAAAETGRTHMPAVQYDAWRRRSAMRTELPSARSIRGVLGGSWPKALEAAGLIRDYEADYFESRPGSWIPDDEILDDLAAAMRAHGGRISRYRYETYRASVRQHQERAPVAPATITARFGSWAAAQELVALEHPEVPYE